MANLTTAAAPTWAPGIYQLEESDFVQGGAEGVDNTPHRQLAERTEWLRREVELARAQITGVVAQGVTVIKTKYVLAGFVLTADNATRSLHLSQSGVVSTAGSSRAFMDGTMFALADVARHVAVPGNPAGQAATLYAYLRRVAGRVEIGAEVPDDALLLYRLMVPANDTGASLAGVTLVDLRPVQTANGWLTSFEPGAFVTLPEDLASTAYSVALDVESATPRDAVGGLGVRDKAVNGFRITASGSADNVRVRWAVLYH